MFTDETRLNEKCDAEFFLISKSGEVGATSQCRIQHFSCDLMFNFIAPECAIRKERKDNRMKRLRSVESFYRSCKNAFASGTFSSCESMTKKFSLHPVPSS
jgi:hypothetical protein